MESASIDIPRIRDIIRGKAEEIVYAGITGSSLSTKKAGDVDVVAVLRKQDNPALTHPAPSVSLLAFDTTWLTYEKHLENPVGLVPSILFKSIKLSLPVAGRKENLKMPKIRACNADWINLEIKKARYRNNNRKNYLVALVFEKLLSDSPTIDKYCFNNALMAEKLGLKEIAEELRQLRDKEGRTHFSKP